MHRSCDWRLVVQSPLVGFQLYLVKCLRLMLVIVLVCSSLDMSVAIFAPGWTHENATSTDFHNSDAFLKRDVKFWNLLAPLLPKPDANYIDIPFSTTFCNGIVFPKSVELESDVDTGVVQTLKASMMYSLGETSMVPRCGPLFRFLDHFRFQLFSEIFSFFVPQVPAVVSKLLLKVAFKI